MPVRNQQAPIVRGLFGLATVVSFALAVGPATGCGRTEPLRPHEDGGVSLTGNPPNASAMFDGGLPDAGEPAPVGCQTGHIALFRATPSVMFVLDRSGSMNSTFGQNTRWVALTNALAATLPAVSLEMEIGALLYPGLSAARSCAIDTATTIAPAFGNAPAVIAQMVVTRPAGQTPTADAVMQAATLLSGRRAAASARALVLATDGAPNCNAALNPRTCVCANNAGGFGCRSSENCLDDTRTVANIGLLRQSGLPTYVIGIQSQNDAAFIATLNAMAVAGGRARGGGSQSYYAANSESEIAAALTIIRDQVGRCVYLTTSVPDSRGSIAVSVNGEIVASADGGTDGWQWGNQANGEIVLSGKPCETTAAQAAPAVEALVVCASADAGQ